MGRYFGNVPVIGAGGAMLAALSQALDKAKRDRLESRELAYEDDQRRRQSALQDFELGQQGVYFTPASYKDITPGSLGPSPVDGLDVSGASASAMNDRIGAATLHHALNQAASVASPASVAMTRAYSVPPARTVSLPGTSDDTAKTTEPMGRQVALAVAGKGSEPDPTTPLVTRTDPGVQYGNGWYQDLGQRDAFRKQQQESMLSAVLAKALTTAEAARAVNPERADATGARADYYRALRDRLEHPTTPVRGPVRGTPQYLDALRAEEAVRAQFRPNATTAPANRTETPVQHALRVAASQTRQALTENDARSRDLDRRAANAVVPSDTLGLGADQAQLTARGDSLRSAYDTQTSQYQSLGLGRGTTTTAPAPAPLGLGRQRGAPALDGPTAARMEQEMATAGADLKTVLTSNAPASVKAQARALHSQHIESIMRRYGVDHLNPQP